jgi:hypothetical protein
MLWRIGGLVGLAILPLVFGFALGIIPGLLLGLPGWHGYGAVILPILWAVGYIKQREANYGDVNWITFSIAFDGGIGLGVSIWLFGTFTD